MRETSVIRSALTLLSIFSAVVDGGASVATGLGYRLSNYAILGGGEQRTREYNFTISETFAAADGVNKTVLVVNNQLPGPAIEANEGDRIIVHVLNHLPNATAIHWHGLYQNGTPWYDGTNAITQCGIPSGHTFTYNFTVPDWIGTTWWHAHSGTQYTDGIFGPIIIHSADEAVPPYSGDIALVMNDWYHELSYSYLPAYFSSSGLGGLADGNPANEPVPDGGLINGVGQWGNFSEYFSYTLEANSTYRLRLINAGSLASISFSIDNHTLTVIEADGTAVGPTQVSSLSLAVAQRYSVLVHLDQRVDTYWIRMTVDDSMFGYDVPGSNYQQLAVLRYSGLEDTSTLPALSPPSSSSEALDPNVLVPAVAKDAPLPDAFYIVYFEFQYSMQGEYLAFMNKTSWTPMTGDQSTLLQNSLRLNTVPGSVVQADQFILNLPTVETVDIILNNIDDGDHPFHLHGYKFQIMAQGEGSYYSDTSSFNRTNPMRRDTIVIPAFSHVVLRIVTDNPGYWALHCHISWHMSKGLLMQLAVRAGDIDTTELPSQFAEQCAALSEAGQNATRGNSGPSNVVSLWDAPPTATSLRKVVNLRG